MLFNFDLSREVFLIGQGLTSKEFDRVLRNHGIDLIKSVAIEQLPDLAPGSQCMIAIRNINERQKIITQFEDKFSWPSFVHDTCDLVHTQSISKGNWLDSFCHVGLEAHIGDFTILSSYSSVSHNSSVGINCFLAPGAILAGSCTIGDRVFFGIKSAVTDHVTVCSDCWFSAGGLTHKSIDQPGRYYGNRQISD
jgi:acetyltransferase-like isoleucine patch superfamily enzyme